MLVKVYALRSLAFDAFLDHTVNFVNALDLTLRAKDQQGQLGSLLLDDQETSVDQYKHVVRVGNLLKGLLHDVLTKLYDQCVEFDLLKNGFIELPVFANILAYNVMGISSELLLSF